MPLSVASVYHLTMEANVHRGDNAFVNGHAFVSHNGNASVTIGESDYGSAKWWYAVCLAQQWGGKSETSVQGTTTQTQTLPVAFTDASYQVVRCVNNTSASNTSIHTNGFGVLSKATTSYTYRYPSVHTGWSHQWIAIGR